MRRPRLRKRQSRFFSTLKEITIFHREKYKLDLRERIVSQLNLNPASVLSDRQEALRTVRRKFSMDMGDQPFYPELVEEVLDEDHSPDSENLRNDLIQRLTVKEQTSERTKEEVTFKQLLLESVRLLTGAGFHLDETIKKLTDNNQLLTSRKMPFMERLRNWIIKLVQNEGMTQIYEVEFFDVNTSSTKTEKVDFNKFVDELSQKSRLFSVMGIKTSPSFRKLQSASDEQVYSFVTRNLEETQLIYRRLNALDTFFKTEVPREERNRLRGIKLELNGIKNCIMKANQKKHEYVAKKEELEQMKKLGLNPDGMQS